MNIYMNICVVGLGYIGLPSASLIATKGFQVYGVDINKQIVDTINQGEIHIYEPDLDILVKAAVQSGKLVASTEANEADIFIIAVPTPFKEDHNPDLSYIESATMAISDKIKPGNLIILESTSPVGTTDKIASILKEMRPDLTVPLWQEQLGNIKNRIYLAHCPERVLPGHILKELVDNDRIIGGIDNESSKFAETFYKKFVTGKLILTDSRTAELAKLTENAFRDVNIAFANELSLICDKLNVDVWELIEIANHHPRVNILQPGPGVGGHCIAVDPWFIVDSAPEESRLIRTARQVNDMKPKYIVNKIIEKASRFKEPVIACFGLAFKKDIDDLRESPSVEIVRQLREQRVGEILVVEPHIDSLPALLNKDTIKLTDIHNAIAHSDIVVILVDHTLFRSIDHKQLKEKIIIDTRGMLR